MLAEYLLPFIIMVAVAVGKRWLSSDFVHNYKSRLTVAFSACKEAGCHAGRALDGHVHGYVPALVCSHLSAIRRPFGRIVSGSGVRRAWKVIEGHR